MQEYRFPVEAGQIIQLQAALGYGSSSFDDPNLQAPLTFVQCSNHYNPSWPYRSAPAPDLAQPDQGIGQPCTPSPTQLHAEQHYEYFRALRPGMVLSASSHAGPSWTKPNRKGAELKFEEVVSEFRDQEGELVVRARLVSVAIEQTPAPEAPA